MQAITMVLLIWEEWEVTNTTAFQNNKKSSSFLEGIFFVLARKRKECGTSLADCPPQRITRLHSIFC